MRAQSLCLALAGSLAAVPGWSREPPATPAAGMGATPSLEPAAAATPKPYAMERWSWTFENDPAGSVQTLVVHNDYGDVRARKSDARVIEAWAVVQRLGRGPEGVGATVERRGSVLTLNVAYPAGRVQDRDPDLPRDALDRFDVTVRVPPGVRLVAHTMRGLVEARRLHSDVEAWTRDGEVVAITTGSVSASTGSGAITAVVSDEEGAAGPRRVLLSSESGAIDLTLSTGGDFDLRAETAGELRSDYPVERVRIGPLTRASGVVGKPVRDVLAVSERGSITVRKPVP